MKHSLLKITALGLMLGATPITGVSASDWHFSGFGTLGAVKTDDDKVYFNHPARTRTRPSRIDVGADSSLNVQVIRRFTTNTSATVQVSIADRHGREYRPRVNWAFISHDLTPGLTLRGGRLRAPFFMLSDSMDVNYAHIWMRPPVEVYGLNPFNEVVGLDMLYRRRVGPGGLHLEVQPFLGAESTIRFPQGSGRLNRMAGLSLGLEGSGLQFRIGHAQGRLAIRYGDPLHSMVELAAPSVAPQLSGRDATARFTSIGAQWEGDRLHLSGEIARRQVDRFVTSSTGWHVTAGYRSGNITPFVTYAENKRDRSVAPRYPSSPLLEAYRASRSNAQRSLSVGARWDVGPDIAVKAQWTRTKVRRKAWGAFFPANDRSGITPSGRRLDTLGLSMDIVF
ncbi:hypothetical protein [Azoarcus taiwanensis]|uniref:Porin domain-containing protein n=1 Tax=Azoarcus taiwanensis TaxID=666964 RepID=A0A972FGP0_9RHOO|nr:hypothetical protein [Azoarcus taiwanensis]NMG01996.1 hypothetical protein [Azoarcus taiwanensis]